MRLGRQYHLFISFPLFLYYLLVEFDVTTGIQNPNLGGLGGRLFGVVGGYLFCSLAFFVPPPHLFKLLSRPLSL